MTSVCRYAWYGDDFTGASDTLATVAAAGLRALLFLGVPQPQHLQAAGPLDALGIAGAARAMGPVAMAQELAPVGRFFGALNAQVLHYKCCSTFDSAPTVGSLGAALGQLQQILHPQLLAVVGGQPSLGRYCAFGNLFAASGPQGAVSRIDRHPTMSRHPVTPMHEADLRCHLAAQGLDRLALIDLPVLDNADDAALDQRLAALQADGPQAILFDATCHAHLARIGRVLWQRRGGPPVLALGASSVAQALIAHWQGLGELPLAHAAPPVAAANGPVFILAGSQSALTARQVAEALAPRGAVGPLFQGQLIDVADITLSPHALDRLAGVCAQALNRGQSVLAHTPPASDRGPSPLAAAQACGQLLKRVLALAPAVRRIGVAGGDTSSMAVQALGLWALSHVGGLCPGVSLSRAHADDPRLHGLEIMLKGGQMGPPGLFERLLHG